MSANSNAILITPQEADALRAHLGQDTLMGRSLTALQQDVDQYMQTPIDVPGHSPAGGYAHNKHVQNGNYIDRAGRLYLITGDEKYAQFTTELLSQYADEYLELGFHIAKNTNPPGRLFHQILNENVWLMYASLGYSCISHTLSDEQRQHIITRLFEPMLDVIAVKYAHHFDTIHNHGIWSVAGAAACAVAIGQEKYLDMALHGLSGDDSKGFLAQLHNLFAPSGYYIEGPYYHRYAIRPLCVMAEITHRYRPDIDILNFKDQVLEKTIQALLSTAYPDGTFPALNDASKTMNIEDEGVLIAASLYAKHYSADQNILGIAKLQGKIWASGCGVALADAYEAQEHVDFPCLPSIELAEGPDGDKGAQGFIRMQNTAGDITQLVMAYGQHGMDHGHFDTLGLTFFNNNQEVLRDYGYGRWVNVEPKFGGRYLPENKSYARQTIAHNTVAVDESCQNNFDMHLGDERHALPHFFIGTGKTQAMSAFTKDYYPGVDQQRSLVLIQHDALPQPLLIDLFRLSSDAEHQYDYALQYAGQITDSNVDYQQHDTLSTLGTDYGYQHLWNVAEGAAQDCTRVSWLQGSSFYTWLSAASPDDTLYFTRTGANDPSFNLRSETSLILRRKASNSLFASVLETHGFFEEKSETCSGADGQIKQIEVVGFNDTASVVKISGNGIALTVMVNNAPNVTNASEVSVEFGGETFQWSGPLSVVES